MSESWTVSAGGHSYGPYSLKQMKEFVAQGRLASYSLVARSGQDQYAPASEDPEIAQFFAVDQVSADQYSESLKAIRPASERVTRPVKSRSQHFGRKMQNPPSGDHSLILIISNIQSCPVANLEDAIFDLGSACQVMPQAWLVTTSSSVNDIRNHLVQKLGTLDKLFVLDATHNKAAWFNYTPEAEARIRRFWQKPQDAEATQKAG